MAQAKSTGRARRKSGSSLGVSATRDGDRFHYIWAATRLLSLLDPRSDLRQITVEGAGDSSEATEPKGSEVIDIVEYYGGTDDRVSKLIVRQFKHSTLNSTANLGIADVGRILAKFALLDNPEERLRKRHPAAQFQFSIVTNRPVSPLVDGALKSIASGADLSSVPRAQELLNRIGVARNAAASLCERVEVQGNVPNVTVLRPELDRAAGDYTADPDLRSAAQLIELIAQHAGTEASGPIRVEDVIAAFGVRSDELGPAPSVLDDTAFFTRESYATLAERILTSTSPVVLTAEGGVGKSTFARALPDLLNNRAEVVVYDCFGQGSYRRPDRPRHRHKDGLIQIAFELAGRGLCIPLLPGRGVEPEEYVKAFVGRLELAARTLALQGGCHLVVVVDAADNAAIAAAESPGGRSFAGDLLKLDNTLPANVHVVLTCRPERLSSLQPPDGVETLHLDGYSNIETAQVVRNVFADATDHDVSELHKRTAGNPRVVAAALEVTKSITECLDTLAGLPAGASSKLDSLLRQRVADAFVNAGTNRPRIEKVAELLTLLRPSVPRKLAELREVLLTLK